LDVIKQEVLIKGTAMDCFLFLKPSTSVWGNR